MKISEMPAWYDGLDENQKLTVWWNSYRMFMENRLLRGCVITGGVIGLSFYVVHKVKKTIKNKNKNVIDV